MPPRIYSTCQLPGCSNPHYATGLCRGHYVSKRNAATRAASYPIRPVPPSPPFQPEAARPVTAATQAALDRIAAQRAAPAAPTLPAAPIVPPAPAQPPSCAIPAAPAIDVPAPPPMLPIVPPPPVAFTVTAEDAAAMRRDYGARVPVGSKVYTLDQRDDRTLYAQVEAILSQPPQSNRSK